MARTVIGLDLGTSGVRAVQVSGGKGSLVLDRYAELPLDRGVIEGGEVKDPDALAVTLKALWAKAGFKSKDVIIGVANSKVIVRQLDLPWMAPADLKKSIAFQVQDYIPMPVDEANLDFHILEEFGEGESRTLRILLVAAATEMVGKAVEAVQAAGLRPAKADLTPFALIRAASSAGDQFGAGAEALVDVGAEVTNIIIHQGGMPRFVRILATGGNGITSQIAVRLGVPQEQAETVKFEVAAAGPATGPVTESVFGDKNAEPQEIVSDHPAQGIVNETVAAFVSDVRTSLDYFLTSSPDVEGLSRVVLSGGGSRMTGLRDRLAAELRIPVEFGKPNAHLTIKQEIPAGELQDLEKQMSVAIGLCLNEVK